MPLKVSVLNQDLRSQLQNLFSCFQCNLIKSLICFYFQTNPTSLEGLSKFIDPSQLTPDLDGTLSYDHGIWIELRCVSFKIPKLQK